MERLLLTSERLVKAVYLGAGVVIGAILLGLVMTQPRKVATRRDKVAALTSAIRESAPTKSAVLVDLLGSNWYVSPRGNDDNPGSIEAPFGTIQHALWLAKPGDAIHVSPGQYDGPLVTYRPGSSMMPIQVIGEGSVQIVGNKQASRVVEIRHSYVWLQHLVVDGKHGPGTSKNDFSRKLVYVQAADGGSITGVRLSDMLIQNAGDECVRLRRDAYANVIQDVTILNCGIRDFVFYEGGKNGEGIYIGTAPEQLRGYPRDRSTKNWLQHLNIVTKGNECVDLKEGTYLNLVEHVSCQDQLDSESGAFDSRGNSNIFIQNHIVSARGAAFRFGGDEPKDGVDTVAIANTIGYSRAGFKVTRWPQSLICANIISSQSPLATGRYGQSVKNIACQE